MYCVGIDDMNEIWFYNFSQQDLDTIIIKRYNKNTNFQSVLDSLVTVTEDFSDRTDYQVIYLSDNLTIDYEYKVELVSTGQYFTISDFIVDKKKCNSGFLCFDYYNSLGSYKVNGETETCGILKISNGVASATMHYPAPY